MLKTRLKHHWGVQSKNPSSEWPLLGRLSCFHSAVWVLVATVSYNTHLYFHLFSKDSWAPRDLRWSHFIIAFYFRHSLGASILLFWSDYGTGAIRLKWQLVYLSVASYRGGQSRIGRGWRCRKKTVSESLTQTHMAMLLFTATFPQETRK